MTGLLHIQGTPPASHPFPCSLLCPTVCLLPRSPWTKDRWGPGLKSPGSYCSGLELGIRPIPPAATSGNLPKKLKNLSEPPERKVGDQETHKSGQVPPCCWHLTGPLRYLGNESQDSHLAGLVTGSQAPEELILWRAAVGDLLVFQVPECDRESPFAASQADLWLN